MDKKKMLADRISSEDHAVKSSPNSTPEDKAKAARIYEEIKEYKDREKNK